MWDPSIFSWKKVESGDATADLLSGPPTAPACGAETLSLSSTSDLPLVQMAEPRQPASSPSSELSRVKVMRSYIKRAVVCGAPYQAIKFCLQNMAAQSSSDRQVNQAITSSKSTRELCKALDLDLFYETLAPKLPPHANTLNYHKMRSLPEVASPEELDRPLTFSSFLA